MKVLSNSLIRQMIILVIVAVACYATGRGTASNEIVAKNGHNGAPLRTEGYSYIKPLLLSDYGDEGTSENLFDLEAELSKLIDIAVSSNRADTVSVFYRDLTTSEKVYINSDEKYYPASLSKVPIMMAYYKLAETNTNLLTSRGTINIEQNYNAGQEIPPTKEPQSGKEYSIQELIDMMVRNSDNSGWQLLMTKPGTTEAMKKMFADLHMYYPYDQTEITDVISAREFSRFLRVLYNATYLNEADSERALQLLSEVEYDKALMAGIPDGIKVAHKFGLNTHRDINSGKVIQRQLHDCGIVYRAEHPYLLCVMTKGSASEISALEGVIKQISSSAYLYKVK